ncbi:MAG: C-terminal binding protein [Spirochaetales bacterium]|nr:C-terminal binding protein [Spirochaetales bacterium]
MKQKPRVVILDSVFLRYDEERACLKRIKADVEVRNPSGENEIIAAVREADAVLVNLHKISARVVAALERCRVISRYGVGYDNVDVEAAAARGIWVAIVPDYCVEEAADHAIALLLSSIRRVTLKDRLIREGFWKKPDADPLSRTSRGTLGILGYGQVGRVVHRKLSNFGFKEFLVCDPYRDKEEIEKQGARLVSLTALLKRSDYVTVHVPLTSGTQHLLGAKELRSMKPGAVLVNTARGPIIDEAALAAALKAGRLGGAGLDVFETEPLPKNHPLLSFPEIILTDHTAYYSPESVTELKTRAADNVVQTLLTGRPNHPVNHPKLGRRAILRGGKGT